MNTNNSKFRIITDDLIARGSKLIGSPQYPDHRGYFAETYSRREYQALGIDSEFVQENRSFSNAVGTLRGLHFQAPPHAQAKLVRCSQGAIFDVAVDIRLGSPTYGQWKGYELTAENGHQLYIPVGFAHGFATLEPESEVCYKCSDYYSPQTEGALLWCDPELDINWPISGEPILSDKDAEAPMLNTLLTPFVLGENS